jgi:hypothetical protein
MLNKRQITVASLWMIATLQLWGGTGRPSDGFLSFILLFGFLVLLLGILQLVSYVKRKIQEILEEIY